MNHRFTHTLAAVSTSLLALTASAQNAGSEPPASAPATTGSAETKLAQAPEQLLRSEPTAAGARAPAPLAPKPLTRAEVIRELQRARAAGEMDWFLRESTGYMR